MNYVIIAVIAYLLGSISTGVVLSKLCANTDIREQGSGNAGTTNMLRVLGRKLALITFIGDMLKGVIVVEPNLPSEITSLKTSVKIGDGTLHYTYADGKVSVELEGIEAELEIHEPKGQTDSPAFEGVRFCMPDPLESYPCFDTYYETALTY